MSFHKYLAEFLGTLVLTFMVWLTLAGVLPVPTPFMAGLTLALFVYMLGGVSGAHFNPAITLAMLSINKIKLKDAGYYIVSQLLGGMAAMMIGATLYARQVSLRVIDSPSIALAEGMGAFLLAFAVTSVTLKKVEKEVAGAVIGGSLFLGIFAAAPISNAVLNPAVAIGIGSFSIMYVIGPVIGAICGSLVSCIIHGEKVKFGA